MDNDEYTKDGRDWREAVRPCGCAFPEVPECICDTSCVHCWPEFVEFMDEYVKGKDEHADTDTRRNSGSDDRKSDS